MVNSISILACVLFLLAYIALAEEYREEFGRLSWYHLLALGALLRLIAVIMGML